MPWVREHLLEAIFGNGETQQEERTLHPAALAKKRAEIRKEMVDHARKIGDAYGIEVSEQGLNPQGSGEIKALRTEEAIKDFLGEVVSSIESKSKSKSKKDKAEEKE